MPRYKAIISDNREGRSRARESILKRVGAQMNPPVEWDCICVPSFPRDRAGVNHSPVLTVKGVTDGLTTWGRIRLLTIDVHYEEHPFGGLEYVYPELLKLDPHMDRWEHVAIFSWYPGQAKRDPDRQKMEAIIRSLHENDPRVDPNAVFISPDQAGLEEFAEWASRLKP